METQNKIHIKIEGLISKEDYSEITQNEYDEFLLKLLDFFESKGYGFGGGFNLLTDEESILNE